LSFKVKFTYDDYNDWGWGAGVDNVAITGTLSSVSFNNNLKTTLYPNPTKGEINIESTKNIESIEVYGILGNLIRSLNGSAKINLTDLNAGTYILKIMSTEGHTSTQKIIKI